MANIWIVDDDSSLRWVLDKTFQKADFSTDCFEDAYHALESLALVKAGTKAKPDVILSDIRMPGLDGHGFLKKVHEVDEHIPVIIMTAHSDLDSAVNSYKTGAFEYLPKPFDLSDAVALANKALAATAEKNKKTEQAQQALNNSETKTLSSKSTQIIGESAAMQEVFRAIGRLAKSNITVLINGESGTGKELVAKALHEHSPRKNKKFIALNMAAIPHDLVESELFGYEKGAFTGATAQRKGRFEQADGGTLFLDEIGDMPFSTQTRLLRVLADGEFFRVGGQTPVKVDVRIIAATHQNLENLVQQNKFREDLFYRLNVIRIHSPALRERPDDVPMLTQHFLAKSAAELDIAKKTLTSNAMAMMARFAWKGNVRQLENTCRWITVMAASNDVDVQDLPPEITDSTPLTDTNKQIETRTANPAQLKTSTVSSETIGNVNLDSNNSELENALSWQELLINELTDKLKAGEHHVLDQFMPEFEKAVITTALKHTKGRKGEAAELLGWGRNTLTRKIQELSLNQY